jgi:hypothetical protein
MHGVEVVTVRKMVTNKLQHLENQIIEFVKLVTLSTMKCDTYDI